MRRHPIPFLRNRAVVALLAVLTVATLVLMASRPARSDEPDVSCGPTGCASSIDCDTEATCAEPIPALVEPAYTG